jgi:uncharacterized membrane-anchored protein YitT (DUF2179 family)
MSNSRPDKAENDRSDAAVHQAASRDLLTLGTVFAALVLFIGTGGSVISGSVSAYSGNGIAPDNLLATAFLLNIALIVFGWRR